MKIYIIFYNILYKTEIYNNNRIFITIKMVNLTNIYLFRALKYLNNYNYNIIEH